MQQDTPQDLYMGLAIELARAAYDDDEVPVGAVIVQRRNNEILSAFSNQMRKQNSSIAHAEMLSEIGVLKKTETQKIIKGLNKIEKEIETGNFLWTNSLEDIHMHIEHRLIEITGDLGKKLHTGRSRNDQIATDMRLFLRKSIDEILALENSLLHSLLNLACLLYTSPSPRD